MKRTVLICSLTSLPRRCCSLLSSYSFFSRESALYSRLGICKDRFHVRHTLRFRETVLVVINIRLFLPGRPVARAIRPRSVLPPCRSGKWDYPPLSDRPASSVAQTLYQTIKQTSMFTNSSLACSFEHLFFIYNTCRVDSERLCHG